MKFHVLRTYRRAADGKKNPSECQHGCRAAIHATCRRRHGGVQNRLKNDPKAIKNRFQIDPRASKACWIDSGTLPGVSETPPGRSKTRPKRSKTHPRRPKRAFGSSRDAPRSSGNAPRTLPRRLRTSQNARQCHSCRQTPRKIAEDRFFCVFGWLRASSEVRFDPFLSMFC